jgi:hypothetical protein
LTQVRIDAIRSPADPDTGHWLAEFRHVDGSPTDPPE